MEAIFSLPYSEYATILQLQKHLTRKKGYAIFVPTSRQQKGIDFLIQNTRTKKVLTVQVKSSRSWVHTDPVIAEQKKEYLYNFWFANFMKNYTPALADIYILFGLYPVYHPSKNIKSKGQFWKSLVLVFTDEEMGGILKQIKTKRTGNPDRFFYIAFTTTSDVVCTRGFSSPSNLAPHVLERRISFLESLLQ